MRLFVVVEGEGEVAALPVLLRRIASATARTVDLAGRPWREPRSSMVTGDSLHRVLRAARLKADAALIIFDADDDCAVETAASVRTLAAQLVSDLPVWVTVAVREYENWFLAAAESLRDCRGLPRDLIRPPQPETIRDAKGWLSDRMARRYSPTLDQAALSATIDLDEAATHSRSFRKLVSDVQAILAASG